MSATLLNYPYAVLSCVALLVLSARRWIQYYQSWVNVPVVGGHGILGSWRAARRFGSLAPELLEEGYRLHGDSAFQVSTPAGWHVCIVNDAMIREYLNAPDQYLSSTAPIQEFFQSKYTAPGLFHKIHSSMMNKALTWSRARSRSTDGYFASLIEHLEYSFQLEIKSQMGADGDWYGFDAYTIARRLTMGLVAKLLVGDLGRDPAIIDLFCEYTAEILIGGPYIRTFPVLLRPIIAQSTRVFRLSNRMQKVFLDLINDRKLKSETMAKEGNQPEGLTDWFWRWSQQDSNNGLTELDIAQLLAANTFGASFNTTVVLVQCICELASRPEYVTLLREEVTSTLKKYNNTWTKEGIESLKKLDSFIKESHRYNCFDVMGAPRVVKQNYTFKNGLTIPRGTVLFSPNRAMLFDEKYLANPNEFDGMRFYDLAMGKGSETPEAFRYTATNSHYLQFGDGKHVCPGRFFAADELRLILAYLLLHFDVRIQGGLPEGFKIGRSNLAQLGVTILLKKLNE